MITCREATELHTLADEGALEGSKKAFYALHMTVCGPCKRYKQQLDTTVQVLRQLPPEEAPPSLVDLLAAELEKKS